MAANSNRPIRVALAAIIGFVLLVAAIIEQQFWLSLTLGIAGVAAFGYSVLMLREYRKSLPANEKGSR